MVDLNSVSEPRPRPEVGWLWARLCGLLGHSYPVRLYERGNEVCDCGADHTYAGCVRCGQHLNVRPWWHWAAENTLETEEERNARVMRALGALGFCPHEPQCATAEPCRVDENENENENENEEGSER